MFYPERSNFYCSSIFIQMIMFFLFTSCESNMNVDIPGQAPKLTVNCILKTDEVASMQITESQSYFESTDTSKFVRNAMVQLFEDNILVDNLIYKEYKQFNKKFGNYISLKGVIPSPGYSYRLEVNVPGFEEVTSITSIPQPVPIKIIVPITDWKDRYEIAPWMIKLEPTTVHNTGVSRFQDKPTLKQEFGSPSLQSSLHCQTQLVPLQRDAFLPTRDYCMTTIL